MESLCSEVLGSQDTVETAILVDSGENDCRNERTEPDRCPSVSE